MTTEENDIPVETPEQHIPIKRRAYLLTPGHIDMKDGSKMPAEKASDGTIYTRDGNGSLRRVFPKQRRTYKK